jgi:aminoglycoside phosphotransferase family enzyme
VHATHGQAEAEFPTEAKVRFLSEAGVYPDRPATVEVVETHMSWVFLADERAYKLKKPVASDYFDFRTLSARENNCRNEVRLNRRLAGDVYLGVARLTRGAGGGLALDGPGETVDWMVVMRRLPQDRMLDRLIDRSALDWHELERLGDRLADFYAGLPPAAITPQDYFDRFVRDQAINRKMLAACADAGFYEKVLDRLDAALVAHAALLKERVTDGRMVDGHGDLRPEHVCMTEPIVIFDCLEFSDALRRVDPVEELAFLGMECAMLDAAWVGPKLTSHVLARLGQDAPQELIALHTAFRATLRARQTLSHLLDRVPRRPERWRPLADRYAAAADLALTKLGV